MFVDKKHDRFYEKLVYKIHKANILRKGYIINSEKLVSAKFKNSKGQHI